MKRAAFIRIAPHDNRVHIVLVDKRGRPICDALLNQKEALGSAGDLVDFATPSEERGAPH
jgi:hypothetical protein